MFEALEAVTVLNTWRVIRCDISQSTSLGLVPGILTPQQRATKLRAAREQKDEQKRRELKKRMEHEQMLEAKPAK